MQVPTQIKVAGKYVYFEKLTDEQLISYQQEQALNGLMRGVPFGEIISESVRIGYILASVTKRKKT